MTSPKKEVAPAEKKEGRGDHEDLSTDKSESYPAPATGTTTGTQQVSREPEPSWIVKEQAAPDGRPVPDIAHCQRFLRVFSPSGPWSLTAIPFDAKGESKKESGRRIAARTFLPGEDAELVAWVLEHNVACDNIYYNVNPTRDSLRTDERASKEHIAEVAYVHGDLDPQDGKGNKGGKRSSQRAQAERAAERDRILAAIRSYPLRPTWLIDSGRGFQVLYQLEPSLPIRADHWGADAEGHERYSRQLAKDLGGDAVADVGRVLRLPGTVNWGSPDKTKAGHHPRLARVVEHNPDGVYPAGEFPVPGDDTGEDSAPSKSSSVIRERVPAVRLDTLDALPEAVTPHVRNLIEHGDDPDKPNPDRSAKVFAVCCELIRRGVPDGLILGIITDPRWPISAHVLEQPRLEKYAWRQIERAHARVQADKDQFDCYDESGNPKPTARNVVLALAKMGVEVEHDEFADRQRINGLDGFGPLLDDKAVARLWVDVESRFNLEVGKDKFWTVVLDHAAQRRRHPVREYLDGLSWDGTPRVGRWLTDYLGVEDTPYSRAVGSIVLVAAVRRVRQPGVKFDEMLILEGPQGGNKSSALAVMAVCEDWFSDDLPLHASAQRFIEATKGRWIVEAGELKGMSKGEKEALKSNLSRQVDRSRAAYGRIPESWSRQFIIIGTTNDKAFLTDSTGNRRYWPVLVGIIDLEKLRADRDQLWAEAAHLESNGFPIRLDPKLYPAAAAEQEKRKVIDPFVDTLRENLGDLEGVLAASDVWKIIGVRSEHRKPADNVRLGEAMRELGWERVQRRLEKGGPPVGAYVKGDAARSGGGVRLTVEVDERGQCIRVYDADEQLPF
ncbi:MAG: virulence-associated E family protein [Planctomycetota bacterium]